MSAKKEELSIRARQLTITQPLEAQKVQMEAGNAENAETLFYGGLGPITKVAAAIRYKVEAEYAGRFNPAEYEAAYRQKFENEIQEFQIAKTEAKEKVTELPEQQALDRKKADLEWLHAGQANLEAAHAAKERAQARKELPTKKSEYELELKKYGTEGALLQNSLGESATAVHFFNESVIAAGLAFAASGAAMANELNNHKRQAQMLRGGVETLQIKTKELGIHPALLVGNPLANPGAVKNLHEHERAMAYGVEHAQVSMIKEHKQAMAHTQSHTHTPEGHADLGNGMTVNVGPITIGGVQAPEQVSSSLKAAIQTGIEDWCQRQQRRSKV
jgi:hypothetical protein